MFFLPARDPVRSGCASSDLDSDILYFERRLEETVTQVADSTGDCARNSHAGRAELYLCKLSELRACPGLVATPNPRPERIHESRVVNVPVDRTPRLENPLDRRRPAVVLPL